MQAREPDRLTGQLFNFIEQFSPFYPATPMHELAQKQLQQTTTGAYR